MLDVQRLKIQTFRWSIFTGALIAGFWTIWWLTGHEVPVAHSAFMIHLPFAVSRWWDIAAGPLASCIVCAIIWKWDDIYAMIPDEDPHGAAEHTGMFVGMVIVIIGEMFAGVGTFFADSALIGVAVMIVLPITAIIAGLIAYGIMISILWVSVRLWRWLIVARDKKPRLELKSAA